MEDKTLLDVLSDIAEHVAANGRGVLGEPRLFRSLFMDCSRNRFCDEARVIGEFLASKFAGDLKADAAGLKTTSRQFSEETGYDAAKCEMAAGACAWLTGLIEKSVFEAALGAAAKGPPSLLRKAKALLERSKAPPTPQLVPAGLKYKREGSNITITGYSGDAADLAIPERIQGFPVTVIGSGAFMTCGGLTSVTIPLSVKTIGDRAFCACGSLTGIAIPPSVTYIGNSAFNGCGRLNSVTIPPSVISIGDLAFFNCYSLTGIAIPPSVYSIGKEAFIWCSSLTSVIIPPSVASIGEKAFNECDSLTDVTLSRRTQLGKGVFPASTRISYSD